MTTEAFFIPSVNLIGSGCLKDAMDSVKERGFKHALIVTDTGLVKAGIADTVIRLLTERHIRHTVFDKVHPNPTGHNVREGLSMLKHHPCDLIISLGGGSSHDCAKAIALVNTNGGDIRDYEGIDKSAKPQLPVVAVNTTAGTGSEMTRFCIITDEERHIKMAIIDKNVTPILSVNDPDLMLGMPKTLTASTGMDALTHAIEAYVSTIATPITDACALKAITLVTDYLPRAVADGHDLEARGKMAYAQFLAGMAFNNASLGYVHSMAHQLGGFYDLPHGVCNAILLPHVEAFNCRAAAERMKDVGQAMRVNADAGAALEAIRHLSKTVGIPSGLGGLGVKEADIPVLAENALKDACSLTNPVQATHAEICHIYRAAL